jgi:hypothetical protein
MAREIAGKAVATTDPSRELKKAVRARLANIAQKRHPRPEASVSIEISALLEEDTGPGASSWAMLLTAGIFFRYLQYDIN